MEVAGLAVTPVSLMEILRPWRTAGVTHFLSEVFEDAKSVDEGKTNDFFDTDRTDYSEHANTHRQRQDHAPHTSSPPPPQQTAHSTPVRQVQPSSAPALPDITSWPAAWQSILSKTASAPLAWTYTELGSDLTGKGSKERSTCLRTLIGHLSLPRGSSAFWPVSLEAAPSPEDWIFFQAGLEQLRPKALVFLGSDALQYTNITLPLHQNFTQTIFKGRLYMLVPGFEALLAAPPLVDKTCVFLRSAFASLPALFLS